MGYHRILLLETTQDADGEAVAIGAFAKLLCLVSVTGTAELSLEARQEGGDWREIERLSADGEVHLENFGWYELRACARNCQDATVKVELSRR